MRFAAAPVGLRRQDHDLPQARRGSGRSLAPLLGHRAPRLDTLGHVCPGATCRGAISQAFRTELARRRPWLDNGLLRRYSRAYGTRIERLLGTAGSMRDLGAEVLPGLHVREIEYLRREEWAVTAEDILFRRSKLGLHLPAEAPDAARRAGSPNIPPRAAAARA